jgi:Uri superfamily endonuclease
VGPDVALVEAAVIEADPEKAEERRLATAMERFVHLGASDQAVRHV